MTAIERTAYPRFKSQANAKELALAVYPINNPRLLLPVLKSKVSGGC